jgi:hypothetical protein
MDEAAAVIIKMPKQTDDDLFDAEIAKDLTDKVFFDDGRYWMQGKVGRLGELQRNGAQAAIEAHGCAHGFDEGGEDRR